jgi:hypothetical protein
MTEGRVVNIPTSVLVIVNHTSLPVWGDIDVLSTQTKLYSKLPSAEHNV